LFFGSTIKKGEGDAMTRFFGTPDAYAKAVFEGKTFRHLSVIKCNHCGKFLLEWDEQEEKVTR
jgi:hypothetical protein